MQHGSNEAFSRILIDKALEASGWNLLDPRQVRFELRGTDGRRADYVLGGQRGPISVLEAKREDEDPYDAKEQAQGYAGNLKAPFVILSNGREHWFWNYTRKDEDAYRIERLPSPEDLERLRLKNMQPPRPLLSEVITPDWLQRFKSDLVLRRYQIKALDLLCSLFDSKRLRKFLLEMATGTGKTLLCAALIRRFLLTRNAERVLFIVDRIELAKQTLEEFNIILAEFKPVLYKTARRRPGELLGSSVVVATLQSLMVDRRYREEFTPFHFDLVINDEAHRSIYGDAREVVQFFQATPRRGRISKTSMSRSFRRKIRRLSKYDCSATPTTISAANRVSQRSVMTS
jgi:type I restriction enzyme, R subunit